MSDNHPPANPSTLGDRFTAPYHGYIERVKAGVIYGWAAAKVGDHPIDLVVLANKEKIGEGRADIFREDLKEHNIHSGKHGFKIGLQVDVVIPTDAKIELFEAESLQPIAHNGYLLKHDVQEFEAEFSDVQNGYLEVSLSSLEALGELKCILLIDEKKELGIEVKTKQKQKTLRFLLPKSVLDQQNHLYQIFIEGSSVLLASAVLSAQPIQTPWKYLTQSYNEPGFLGVPPPADFRYESLKYQVDAANKHNSLDSLGAYISAHDVLCQGYEGRTTFPKLSLPEEDKPLVSIILPAFNKFELTYHAIASIILAHNQCTYELILADDCSDDMTQNAQDIVSNLVIARSSQNKGFLRNCNEASQKARGKYLVFLNNDTEVTSQWLDELIDVFEQHDNVGISGAKLLNADGSLQEAGGIVWNDGKPWNVGRDASSLDPRYNYVRQVDYVTGAAFCIKTDVWQQVGMFSDEFAPCYFEDTDLAYKVRQSGFKVMYTPFAQVVHAEGQSHGKDVNEGLKTNQKLNQITFGKKWFQDFKHNGIRHKRNLDINKDRFINHRILVLDNTTPDENRDAGSYAMVQEMQLMIALGAKLTFLPHNLAHFGKLTKRLQKMGVEVLYAPFYKSVGDVLKQRINEFDAFFIVRYDVAQNYMDIIREKSNAKIIFNNADLHFLREIRGALNAPDESKLLKKARKTRKAELEVCKKADAVLCYNTVEHAVITSHILQADKFHVTPWVLTEKPPGKAFKDRHGLAFLGSFNHTPNVESIQYLSEQVMPALYSVRPDIVLYVYGSNMPDDMQALETNNLKMVGYAQRLDDVYCEHRIFVAPLLSGAGIKGKVLEAMAYKLPVVLTDVAREGTGLNHEISCLVAENVEQWVEQVCRLYDDEALWNKLAENEKIIADSQFSKARGIEKMRDIFASVNLY
ncbi:glycosyltransferase [Ningiella sp. W23]|uniref:glycosyltransferase n=1 Tax=Ningiella sp. W23 TaxID=3023715 RepID=UPI003756866A